MKKYMQPKPVEIEKCAECGTEVRSYMLDRNGICTVCGRKAIDEKNRAMSAGQTFKPVAHEDHEVSFPTAAELRKLDAECAAVKIEQEKLDAMMEHCQ
jgi:DNA-directed RNA polymerase subunit RPC12/RpoP